MSSLQFAVIFCIQQGAAGNLILMCLFYIGEIGQVPKIIPIPYQFLVHITFRCISTSIYGINTFHWAVIPGMSPLVSWGGKVTTCLVLAQETCEDCGQKHMALQNTRTHAYQTSVVLLTAGTEAELVYKWDCKNLSTLKERTPPMFLALTSSVDRNSWKQATGQNEVGLMSQPQKKVCWCSPAYCL